jgi:hypothetical protein
VKKKGNLATTTSKGNYQTLIVMKIIKLDHKKASFLAYKKEKEGLFNIKVLSLGLITT